MFTWLLLTVTIFTANHNVTRQDTYILFSNEQKCEEARIAVSYGFTVGKALNSATCVRFDFEHSPITPGDLEWCINKKTVGIMDSIRCRW